MLEPVSKVVETLEKERKKFVFNFTPKDSNSEYKRRNRFNYMWHVRGSRHTQVKYGYYEIKDSSLGPVMFLLDDESMVYNAFIDVITVKIPAIKWHVCVREGCCGFSEAVDFIHRMPKVETKLSSVEAKRLYDTYLDIPLPETAKNVQAPNVWKDSEGITPEFFEAVFKLSSNPRPFELSDFNLDENSNSGGYIPYLVIALLLAVNFAGAPARINTAAPKAKQVMATTHRQSQANYINYLTALQKVRGC